MGQKSRKLLLRNGGSKENDDDADSSSSNSESTSDDSDNDVGFVVNEKYAKEYNQRKRREELTKHKKSITFSDNVLVKQIDDENADGSSDDDDSSVSSSEDEQGELLTPRVDLQILKTINAIREGHESVYDQNVKFFNDKEDDESSEEKESEDHILSKSKEKKKRFKDVVREQILEQMDNEELDKKLGNEEDIGDHRLAYDAEQREIREQFLESLKTDKGPQEGHGKADNDSSGSDEEEWFVKKKREQRAADEEELQDSIAKEIVALKGNDNKSNDLLDPKGEVTDGEAFLRDFLLHRKWVDKDDNKNDDDDSSQDDEQDENVVQIKAAKEDIDKSRSIGSKEIDASDDDSLEELERMDAFESKYNFRFEENNEEGGTGGDQGPSRAQIVSYGRGLSKDLIRRPDDKRKKKREQRKERKAAERKAKEEQLRRLRNAKREELQEKMEQIKKVSGKIKKGNSSGEGLDEEALMKLMEEDFDPDKFSSAMENLYGADFYEEEDSQWKTDKDVQESMKTDEVLADAEPDVYDYYDEDMEVEDGDGGEEAPEFDENGESEYPEEDYNEDDDYEAGAEEEEESELEKKLKSKMQDELYKLDYEDIIAGMPCRFKYRQVEANDYGLSCEEVLLAKDSTLREFVSLKKMTPYREDGEYHTNSRKRQRFRKMLDEDVKELLEEDGTYQKMGPSTNTVEAEIPSKKKKRRRQKKKKNEEEKDNLKKSFSAYDATKEEASGEKDEELKAKKERNETKNSSDKPIESNVGTTTSTNKGKHKRKRKKKKSKIDGVPSSRLASYGL